MAAYVAAIREADFRRLWTAAVVSFLGDGATWVALAWLAVTMGGTGGLVAVTVAYTLPVLGGGIAVGPLLDHFSRRTVMVADAGLRGAAVASIPLAAAAGRLTLGHVAVVAALYGLLKIIPLAGVPAVLPDLVQPDHLQAASALETVGYSVAGLIGPAVGGFLIPIVGAANVLLLDAATYLYFGIAVALLRAPMPRPSGGISSGWGPALRFVLRDRAIFVTTAAFMAFNVAAGMLLVVEPWLARYRLREGPQVLGLLLASMAAGEVVGSLLAGSLTSRRRLVRIGVAQALAGVALLLLLGAPSLAPLLAGLFLLGLFSAPLTVLAQVVRLQRTPAQLRGRTMTLLRTLMQGATPLGSALAGIPLAAGGYGATVALMAVVGGTPGILVALYFARTDL